MIDFYDKASVFSVLSESPFAKLVFFLNCTHINIREGCPGHWGEQDVSRGEKAQIAQLIAADWAC